MIWTTLTSQQKADAVRPLLEKDGATYTEAAAILGTTRLAIAGVVKRNNIRTTSTAQGGWNGGQTSTTGKKARRARKEKLEAPKRRHQGYDKFVPLAGARDRVAHAVPPDAIDVAPLKAGAWDPLPGSQPVSLEHRTGCAWPCSESSPHVFCNLPVKEGRSWCDQHYALGARPIAVGTPVRRAAKPDRGSP